MKNLGLYDNDLSVPRKQDIEAVKESIPTKVSQLTNDSGYVTSEGVLSVTVTGSKADKTFDEIAEAYNNGHIVQCRSNGLVYDLSVIVVASKLAYFVSLNGHTTVQRMVCNGDSWSSGLEYLVDAARTINGKSLATNITLTASDVGALPSDTEIPTKTSQLENDSGYLTSAPVTSVNGQTGDVTVSTINVVLQSDQPTGQTTGDFWYKIKS